MIFLVIVSTFLESHAQEGQNEVAPETKKSGQQEGAVQKEDLETLHDVASTDEGGLPNNAIVTSFIPDVAED